MHECTVITYSKSKDQAGKVANPARRQLNREKEYFHVPIRNQVRHGKYRCTVYRRYFQQAYFIPIVGVGKRGEY